MVQQDVLLGKEVIYQAKHMIVVGRIRGMAQMSSGVRMAVIETKERNVFMGDIQHMMGVDQLLEL